MYGSPRSNAAHLEILQKPTTLYANMILLFRILSIKFIKKKTIPHLPIITKERRIYSFLLVIGKLSFHATSMPKLDVSPKALANKFLPYYEIRSSYVIGINVSFIHACPTHSVTLFRRLFKLYYI